MAVAVALAMAMAMAMAMPMAKAMAMAMAKAMAMANAPEVGSCFFHTDFPTFSEKLFKYLYWFDRNKYICFL